jgi:uncharacterized membrane protein HdeD (DUF308 family)
MTAQDAGQAGRAGRHREPGADVGDAAYGADAGSGLYQQESAAAWASGWQVVLLVAVLTLACGVILLVWPHETLIVVAAVIGAALVITGLFRLVGGFTARGVSGGTRAAYVIIGLLATLAGLYCLRHLSVTVVLVAFIVGVFWTLHGIVDLIVAATSGPGTGRGLRAFVGLLSLAAGLIVMFWPSITLSVLLWVMGVWLLAYGLMLGVMAFQIRHFARTAVA